MRKIIYLLILSIVALGTKANIGDTTWVYAQNVQLSGYGNYDSTVVFPNGALSYRKIYMVMTVGQYNCTAGTQYCHQWDYDLENYIMTPGGDTLEMTRFITPYATTGTPGFGPSWKQHYIFDVTDYYNQLKNTANVRVHYSGYSGGFTLDVKFAFIEGTPERNVIGISKLWTGGYTYGNLANVIDSNVKPITLPAAAGMQSAEMKVAITGHGSDNATGCCEFDATGAGHTYTVMSNNNAVGQKNMNVNCGAMELYPQGGTWAYARAGNWCPGGLVTVDQYKLTGVTAGGAHTVDLDFDNSYNGVGGYGIYNIAASVFYYGAYNHTVDASLEDIAAPTNFEWYHRENPRAGKPIVKVRNTGSTAITSILFQYGVKDSALSQYIWTGSLAPSADTMITLPAISALTNLSLESAPGLYSFEANIVQVNGTADDDVSNNTLTSSFAITPQWPAQFAVNMLTSSIDVTGDIGSSSPNLSDASWQITDANDAVVASRSGAVVKTSYKDTIDLIPGGFYKLSVSTSQCVGLHWWPLDGQTGYVLGTFVVRDFNNSVNIPVSGNVYAGIYHDDFGCGFTQYFTTLGECQTTTPVITRIGDTLYASPASGYQWYYNGHIIGGATHASYAIQHNNGNYTVVADYGGGCTNNSASYAVVNLGV
ncbi:MAG: hypothetical protein JWO03_974, partial [Bacteroidetes bacterium]|nr:hypothetical protein [Bacteroidota bacterium]